MKGLASLAHARLSCSMLHHTWQAQNQVVVRAASASGRRSAHPAAHLLLQIASAAFAALARFGTGGFAVGYKSEFVDAGAEAGKYSVMTAGGRAVRETSKVRQRFWLQQTCEVPAICLQPAAYVHAIGCPCCRLFVSQTTNCRRVMLQNAADLLTAVLLKVL